MESENITELLTIALIISVVILFVLVGIFLVLNIKKRQKENEEKKKKNGDVELSDTKNGVSKTIQTKMYSVENIKNFMDFDEIKDNMIIQKNGKRMVMVLQCQGVNYDLMSSIEKVGVEQGFIQFLNTLTRPIQIYVQSRKVNLEESISNYNKKLKIIEQNYNKIRLQYQQLQRNGNENDEKFKNIKLEYFRQKNLYEYTKDIINNTEKMSLNKNILTKNYYIAISYYPDNSEDLFKKEEIIDMAFSELYTNAQAMIRTLSVCGITGKVLNSVELADLLYVAYNRDASEVYGVDKAIRAGYDSLYTTAPDIIDKKILELDKIINEKALNLANKTLDEVSLDSRRKRELEEKERNMDELIKNMAKNLIQENQDYIPTEIVDEAIKKIEKLEKKKTKTAKKGA